MAAKPFESRIQDLVYNVDVGIGLRLIKSGLYLLFIMILMLMYTATQFRGLRDAQAMDSAQLARNLALQKSFVTKCVRPASMWYLIQNSRQHNPQIEQHPDIVNPPVYPMLLAAAFTGAKTAITREAGQGIYAPEQWIIIPINHVATLLGGLFLFFLAQRLFDRRVALVSLTIYFLSDIVWAGSISGTGVSFCVLWSVLTYYLILVAGTNAASGRSLWTWVLPFLGSVLFAVLGFLTRYGLIVLVPGAAVLFAVLTGRRGWLWAGAYLLLFLLGIAPWLARNVIVSGGLLGLAPYTAFLDTRVFPGTMFMRNLAPTLEFGPLATTLQLKWLEHMDSFSRVALPSLGGSILMALFVTTYFYRFVRREVHCLRWSVALSILLLGFLSGFYGDSTANLLCIFYPFIVLYAVAFFYLLLDRLQFNVQLLNTAMVALLIFLSALPLIFTLLPPRASVPYPPYFPPYITHVSRLLKPSELLCTDMPWATAWYGQRNSVYLPATIDEFYEINDYNKRFSGLYFTTLTRDKPWIRQLVSGPERTWFPILQGRITSDFPLNEGFPLSNMDQLFLTDRPRWNE